MNMDQEKFNEKEALGVIEEMVNSSRHKLKDEAKYFLLWGWMVFAAAIVHFIFLLFGYVSGWIVWPIFMGLSLVIYGLMVKNSGKQRESTTYVDRINKYLWLGFLGPLLITLLIGGVYGWVVAYPFFMAIYGWSAIVSGGLLKFAPLVWGGIASYVLGVTTVFVPDGYILIMLAAAVLLGFIIPGHVLRRAES